MLYVVLPFIVIYIVLNIINKIIVPISKKLEITSVIYLILVGLLTYKDIYIIVFFSGLLLIINSIKYMYMKKNVLSSRLFGIGIIIMLICFINYSPTTAVPNKSVQDDKIEKLSNLENGELDENVEQADLKDNEQSSTASMEHLKYEILHETTNDKYKTIFIHSDANKEELIKITKEILEKNTNSNIEILYYYEKAKADKKILNEKDAIYSYIVKQLVIFEPYEEIDI